MPRGGPRGNKKTHKGQRRHFTDESEMKHAQEKEERQKEWRRKQGIESEEEEEVEGKEVKEGEEAKGAAAPGDLPPSSSEESSDDESDKHKGIEHLIEVENPNRMKGRAIKKVTELEGGKTELTRREREEIEKQQAKANYQKMHMAGKTDEARADLARLAIIRKQREEATKKKEAQKAKEEAVQLPSIEYT
ncbi:uncharacterized protein LOC143045895 isoform X1 [Mytilus galloprovincialis]|uniref:uncharacterized protein LOC143045895 isoform X1 n=1 Tax=Mytilus galloprovincialis TaxID=29158 RepID=UPI003F7C3811